MAGRSTGSLRRSAPAILDRVIHNGRASLTVATPIDPASRRPAGPTTWRCAMTGDERRLAIDIVVPLYNEEQVVAEFHRQLMDVVVPLRRDHDIRIHYVNDGSVDHTGAEVAKLAADDPDVTVLELSRNFGHQAALTAGLDRAEGDAALTLDGDGQHPPELIPDMLALYRAGY